MIIRKSFIISFSIFFGFIGTLLIGCTPIKVITPEKDSLGCDRPVQTVAVDRQELSIAGAKIGEFVLGKIDYKSQPEFVEIMTKASIDPLVIDYLVCVAKQRRDIGPDNTEQVDYIRTFFYFMQNQPTPDQIIDWRKKNPLPTEATLSQQTKFIALTLTNSEKALLALGYQSKYDGIPEAVKIAVQPYMDDIGEMPNEALAAIFTTSHQSLVSKGLIENIPIKSGGAGKLTFSIQITSKGEEIFKYLLENQKF